MNPCGADASVAGTVAEAMVSILRTADADVSVAELRRFFADDHVHAALIVREGVLLAVVERDDLPPVGAAQPAVGYGRLAGRTVTADVPLAEARRLLDATGRRRLAVVDDGGRLLGLLCLKRTRRGFCSDADVRERARERAGTVTPIS